MNQNRFSHPSNVFSLCSFGPNLDSTKAPKISLAQVSLTMSATQQRYEKLRGKVERERERSRKFGQSQVHATGRHEKKRTVTTLQWVWILGHLFIMITGTLGILAGVSLQGKRPIFKLMYRSTFVAALFTYGNSLRQQLGGELPGFFALLPVETFQYLLLAGMWLVSPKHVTKLAQFLPISFMHVMDFASVYISRKDKTSRAFNWYIEHFSYRVNKTIGFINLFMFLQLFYDCLRLRPFSAISLVFYLVFYRIRLMFAPITKESLDDLFKFVDNELSQPNRPEFLRKKWQLIKNRTLNSSYNKMAARQQEVDAIDEMNAEL